MFNVLYFLCSSLILQQRATISIMHLKDAELNNSGDLKFIKWKKCFEYKIKLTKNTSCLQNKYFLLRYTLTMFWKSSDFTSIRILTDWARNCRSRLYRKWLSIRGDISFSRSSSVIANCRPHNRSASYNKTSTSYNLILGNVVEEFYFGKAHYVLILVATDAIMYIRTWNQIKFYKKA